MKLRPRTDVLEIRKHLQEMKGAAWMDTARRWWPDHLFHCTDIRNAVSILRHGALLSRTQAKQIGALALDIASPQVIAQTDASWQDYVRLYFRPKTPTQYRNEGFRPKAQQTLGAHCPVPIYFLFDAVSVLELADSLFTDGNVASGGAVPTSSTNSFKQIPFELVYHDTAFPPQSELARQITYHRNAEVLVPQRLDLGGLKLIGCRSQAEYETLLHLLPVGTRSQWADKVGVRPNLGLFHNRWTFVEQVEMSTGRLLFRFNKSSSTPGPFDARVDISESLTGLRYRWERRDFHADDHLNIPLTSLRHPQDYSVSLFLDENPAFAGRFQQEELPF